MHTSQHPAFSDRLALGRLAACARSSVPWLAVVVVAQGACCQIMANPISFRNEVMAVLSKAGCNQGACHGNQNGKNGFKLSLRGQDPDFDLASLSRDMHGRRIDPLKPDESLLLLKATAKVPHEGGRRFT